MKKFLYITITVTVVVFSAYYTFIYFVSYSQGYRAGELVKFSKKGVVFKTWEGQISQEATQPLWNFSVQDNKPEVISKLKALQGKHVNLTYKERFKTFPWLGDTKYFVIAVEETRVSNKINPGSESENTKLESLQKENKMLKQRIKDLETTIEILRGPSGN